MVGPKESTVGVFKALARQNYRLIYQEICKKIQARQDIKNICYNPKIITKKALQLSYSMGYHELGAFRFVKLTIDLSDTVIEKLVSASNMAEVVFFLEENGSLRA